MFKTIWSEDHTGYPDQEVSHVFLPFVPFVYAYVWLSFYRNGCFCKVPSEDQIPYVRNDRYYTLFIH